MIYVHIKIRICLKRASSSRFRRVDSGARALDKVRKCVVKTSVNPVKTSKHKPLVCLLIASALLFGGCASSGGDSSSNTGTSSVPVSSSQTSSSQPEAPSSSEASSSENSSLVSGEPSSTVDEPSSSESSNPQKPGDASYFDDAVFVGDSVTLKLKYYVMNQRKTDPDYLGKAEFLCSGSLGSANALWKVSDESVHPMYEGKKMLLEDSIQKIGAEKVYIMLGVNDIGLYGIDDSIKNFDALCQKILKKSPNAKIYAQSVTPMVKGKELKDLNNKNIKTYDEKLQKLCEDKGYYFIDVASVMRDKDGYLPLEYCSDPSGTNSLGIHFTDKACQMWVDYLMSHTV